MQIRFNSIVVALLLAPLALVQAVATQAQSTPLMQGAVSRKVHGAAGTFDLALGSDASNPATEPRLGPTHTLVFTFDGAVMAGTAALTEGAATVGTPAFSGNELIVPLSAVSNGQYVTVAVSNVSTAGGGAGGFGSIRIGFLAGDVNQNRVVTLADLGLVNAQVAQVVTAANYLKDVNASGTLSLSDKGNTNTRLTQSLPGPGEVGLPPDPATIAPPVDPTVVTDIAASTAFLYSGANPIQTGVVPGTIDSRRAAVLRGRVLNQSGAVLSGVTITVLNHPEFGQTLSRADGRFDLVVNGGGLLTLTYRKSGLITAQRQVNSPWRDYAKVSDVALIALDSRVSAIDLTNTATAHVAQGNPMTDVDGTRQAAILFPAGTLATMTLANGSTVSLTSFHVRATEFTVGPNGPVTMPAALPPSSGYTYEVEYSVDEADAAGATRVSFSNSIISYTENFLNFPIGTLVPSGEYDRKQGVWIATKNGRVIKILSNSGGLVTLDIDGSGQPASASALAGLGINTEELQKLAVLYPSAQSLWRVPIDHFLSLH